MPTNSNDGAFIHLSFDLASASGIPPPSYTKHPISHRHTLPAGTLAPLWEVEDDHKPATRVKPYAALACAPLKVPVPVDDRILCQIPAQPHFRNTRNSLQRFTTPMPSPASLRMPEPHVRPDNLCQSAQLVSSTVCYPPTHQTLGTPPPVPPQSRRVVHHSLSLPVPTTRQIVPPGPHTAPAAPQRILTKSPQQMSSPSTYHQPRSPRGPRSFPSPPVPALPQRVPTQNLNPVLTRLNTHLAPLQQAATTLEASAHALATVLATPATSHIPRHHRTLSAPVSILAQDKLTQRADRLVSLARMRLGTAPAALLDADIRALITQIDTLRDNLLRMGAATNGARELEQDVERLRGKLCGTLDTLCDEVIKEPSPQPQRRTHTRSSSATATMGSPAPSLNRLDRPCVPSAPPRAADAPTHFPTLSCWSDIQSLPTSQLLAWLAFYQRGTLQVGRGGAKESELRELLFEYARADDSVAIIEERAVERRRRRGLWRPLHG